MLLGQRLVVPGVVGEHGDPVVGGLQLPSARTWEHIPLVSRPPA